MFKASNVTFASKKFCEGIEGFLCPLEVMALVEFLDCMNYPSRLVSSWSDNDTCNWVGITCNVGKVSILNLPHYNLSSTLSPSLGKLDSLSQIRLQSKNLSGSIPKNWTSLKALETLDLSDNSISGPLPEFSSTVKLVLGGNPLLNGDKKVPSTTGENAPSKNSDSPTDSQSTSLKGSVASFLVLAFLVVPLSLYYCKKRQDNKLVPSLVVHPRDLSDSNNVVKVVVASNCNGSTSVLTRSGSASRNSSWIGESHIIEAGSLFISVQVLRNVTKNFAPKNELGRGGFGVVYKGKLNDGTQIAVKRMEAGVIRSKALDEFQVEIAVLSKARHRALSKHLFHWKSLKFELLSLKRQLNIALDVARGIEYLHILAHQSFIHRDLNSSNILLGNDFRAKVSDFGLVKLAPDGERSVVTRLARTFGYLAPEYADKEKLRAAIDPSLDIEGKTFKRISIIAELVGHCTAREPSQRPDMGHAVNVLAPLVEKWKPLDDDNAECCGIGYNLPLNQMVKGWQEAEGKKLSYMDLEDNKGSIPARPTGFADSFTSADGR
ncbi:Leucine-rich repeat protein kinase family protein isoform 2 [Hibiscus syriacus]|uniref:Leucine-rich repeat protein kinase family protein isoform 2 n=1 Tax=Hibiscus syriacus TaxID=106335 RepID=A0A6A3AKI7_HIBSY|nr:Leucine-rich repeat protein kinase family protein isoform 2 [Hibiscus syriacus]